MASEVRDIQFSTWEMMRGCTQQLKVDNRLAMAHQLELCFSLGRIQLDGGNQFSWNTEVFFLFQIFLSSSLKR